MLRLRSSAIAETNPIVTNSVNPIANEQIVNIYITKGIILLPYFKNYSYLHIFKQRFVICDFFLGKSHYWSLDKHVY
ncbi:hypothetical protein Pcaca04_04830 [Pectobacterium carotovorum subsp. carotovorum]|nr:hypothetical protein Pcaca04_04830 [Pectobacterium carotovorum subsp. carotovorum]